MRNKTNIPHQLDENGDLLWVGGTAEQPWICLLYTSRCV